MGVRRGSRASSGGSVASTDITDSTSVGRSVLTATDAAAARTALGVTGVSAGAIADLSNWGNPTNAFHLLEPAGAFADHGSAPQTLTVTGGFRRGRLGPRALVPGVWPPVSPAGTLLSFPAWLGWDQAFSLGLTIRGNGEAGPSGKIIQTGWDGSPIHEVVWVDPTHVRVILHHATGGPVLGPLIAVDPTKPLRILYTYVYHSPWLYVNGVGTDCGSDWSFTNSASNNVAALIEATGFSANDLEFWSGVTLTADQAVADYERYASSFRY